jgi:hypothetical protein
VNGIISSHFSQTTGLWSTPLTISPRTRKRSYAANVSDVCLLIPVASSSPRLKMYYEPHASRSNLIVLTSAHVTRISIPKAAAGEATAESISFLYEGNEYRALVKKEVIVSAGYARCSPRDTGRTLTRIHLGIFRAIMSPQVTMRALLLIITPYERRS